MEPNFQTSFIPKKSMIEQPITSKRSVGVLLIISIIIFITMAGISGFVYLYRDTIDKNITQMQVDLSKAKNRFEPSEITKLKTLDKRLQASSEVLSKHIAISPIFEALSSLTLKTVRYNETITREIFGFLTTNLTTAHLAAPLSLSILQKAVEVLNFSHLGVNVISPVKPWVTGCVERSKMLRKMKQAVPGINVSDEDLTSAVTSMPKLKKRRM